MIQVIESLDDPRLDLYAHVGDPAWLCDRGLFVAEGRLVVDRLIESGRFEVVSVLLTPAAQEALKSRLETPSSEVLVATQPVLNGVTGYNFHRGCLALARRPVEASMVMSGDLKSVVALEGVGNPDNVGGIFRSAAAFGVDAILLDASTGDPFYRKSIRTSMGAVLRVPFARLRRLPEELIALKTRGFTVAGLTPAAQLTIDEFARHSTGERVVLVAGAEGGGLSAETLAACGTHVRIPIDPRNDSLNVVVAVSIALHRLKPDGP